MGQFSNGPYPMQAYEPSPHNYRCCTHNYGMGWPFFTESLWGATGDQGLCAAMYSPCAVTAKVGDGTPVTITEETDYPFSETITFTVQTPKALAFPLYFRIPGWEQGAAFQINGQDAGVVAAQPLSYVKIARTWKSRRRGDAAAADVGAGADVGGQPQLGLGLLRAARFFARYQGEVDALRAGEIRLPGLGRV